MNNLTQAGRIIFAVAIIGLSIFCIVYNDFIVGRPPAWPATLTLNPVLGYVSAALMVVIAFAIVSNQKGGLAASILAVMILCLSVFRHVPVFMNDWGNAYKAMALFGGTLIIACSFFKYNHNIIGSARVSEGQRKTLIMIGCILLAAFLISCGYAHYKFADFVKDYIPAYIPFHTFWTYFTAACLVAGGIGIVIPQTRKLAALLCGVMVLGWFFLLHIPRFIANPSDFSDRLGLCESFAFGGIFFALSGISTKK